MRKKAFSYLCLIFISFLTVFSLILCFPGFLWADVTYPDYSSFVNDYTGTLDSSWKSQIEQLCAKVEAETGAEIAVAIVDNLQGITIEEYAVELFSKWGIGKAAQDNGILLLISIQERKLRIEVGYGLEGVITDLESGEIINNIIVPSFKQNDYNTGVYQGVYAIASQIYQDQGKSLEGSAVVTTEEVNPFNNFFDRNSWCSNPFLLCCVPIFLLISLVSGIRALIRRRCPRCHKLKLVIKDTVIQEATYTSSGKMLEERTCSNCGYYDKKIVTIPKKTRSSGGGAFFGGGGGSSGGGGFGGFGGGSSGGGGASGGW